MGGIFLEFQLCIETYKWPIKQSRRCLEQKKHVNSRKSNSSFGFDFLKELYEKDVDFEAFEACNNLVLLDKSRWLAYFL